MSVSEKISSVDRLSNIDADIYDDIQSELERQRYQIELIASENFASQAVIEAQGSVLTNKYAEGYPGKRYYGGCEHVDKVEEKAIERAKSLFSSQYANVQPHSGSQANQAVYLSMLKPGDRILGMSLSAGGHLTHGAPPNLSGKWFDSITYDVHEETHEINYDQVKALAEAAKPKLIIAGASAYAQFIDFKYFRHIADQVGAILLADVAHYAGLIAAKAYPTPIPYAHIVTSTTHKTLRGPRGGLILMQEEDIAKKINSAVFPGLQGGPLMHVIAAKAVAFREAMSPSFKNYAHQTIKNAKTLCKTLQKRGLSIVAGGTESHLVLVDLTPKSISGKDAEEILEKAQITCNKNAIPFDKQGPRVTSGIRLGTAAMTTRGFKEQEFELVGHMIADVIDGFQHKDSIGKTIDEAQKKVVDLCRVFPLYPGV